MRQSHPHCVSTILLLTMLIQVVLQAALPTPAIADKSVQTQQERRNAEQQLIDRYTPQIEQMFAEYSQAVPVVPLAESPGDGVYAFLRNRDSSFSLHIRNMLDLDTKHTYGGITLTAQEQRDVFFKALGQYIGRHINQSRQAPSFRHNPNYRESASPTEISNTLLPYNEDQVIHGINFLIAVADEMHERERRDNRTLNANKKLRWKLLLDREHINAGLEPGAVAGGIFAIAGGALSIGGLLLGEALNYELFLTMSTADVGTVLRTSLIAGGIVGSAIVFTAGYKHSLNNSRYAFLDPDKPAYATSRGSQALIQGLLSGLDVTDENIQKQFISALENLNIEPIRAALCEGALTPKSSAPRVRVALQPAPIEPQKLEEDYDEATSEQQSRLRSVD